MTNHSAGIHAQIMVMDGDEWILKSAYDEVCEKLAEKQRSKESHNRYFAAINDMFQNLPARHADASYAKSQDHFRKHGLMMGGFCDVATVDVETHSAALAIAPVVSENAKKAHGHALTIVRGSLVVCTTPHSQSFKAMGKDKFHESVAACEEWAKALLGIAA